MKIYLSTLKLILVLIFIGYFASNFYGLIQTSIRNQAIDACMNASKYQASYKENDRDIQISQTQDVLYQNCLKDKGIK